MGPARLGCTILTARWASNAARAAAMRAVSSDAGSAAQPALDAVRSSLKLISLSGALDERESLAGGGAPLSRLNVSRPKRSCAIWRATNSRCKPSAVTTAPGGRVDRRRSTSVNTMPAGGGADEPPPAPALYPARASSPSVTSRSPLSGHGASAATALPPRFLFAPTVAGLLAPAAASAACVSPSASVRPATAVVPVSSAPLLVSPARLELAAAKPGALPGAAPSIRERSAARSCWPTRTPLRPPGRLRAPVPDGPPALHTDASMDAPPTAAIV